MIRFCFLHPTILFFVGCFYFLSAYGEELAIYGTKDSRMEVYSVANPNVLKMSRAVALVSSLDWVSSPDASGNRIALRTHNEVPKTSIGKPDRRHFAHQAMAGNCTSFLIDPTHLLTAGHCLGEQQECPSLFFIFDYIVPTKESAQTRFAPVIHPEQVKTCKQIVKESTASDHSADYALIELSEPQYDRPAFSLTHEKGLPSPGTRVAMLGFPDGKPMKYTDGGAMVLASHNPAQPSIFVDPTQFVTNLDSFAGNSGSPVFDPITFEVLGIMTDGAADEIVAKDHGIDDAHYPLFPTPKQMNDPTHLMGERVTGIGFLNL